jgi:hypothetical protein
MRAAKVDHTAAPNIKAASSTTGGIRKPRAVAAA